MVVAFVYDRLSGFSVKVCDISKDVGFPYVCSGDVYGFVKDFEKGFFETLFFVATGLWVIDNRLFIGGDCFLVVFDDFGSAVFLGTLVGVVGFEFTIA